MSDLNKDHPHINEEWYNNRKEEENRIFPLFSFPVALMKERYIMSNDEFDFLTNLETPGGLYPLGSANRYVLHEPKLKYLHRYILRQIEDYAYNILKFPTKTKFRITQSWTNVAEKDKAHHQHKHNNSVISGVYYISGRDIKIKFQRMGELFSGWNFEYEEFNMMNAESFTLNAFKNSTLIFPSNLTHEVESLKNEVPRISLAFNTMVYGHMGNYNNSTELTLRDDTLTLEKDD